MTNSKTLLLLNGEFPSPQLLRKELESARLFVCTDGAASELRRYDIIPNTIIGDLDSLSIEDRGFFSAKCEIIEQSSQYSTDFEKALDYLSEKDCSELTLLGLKGKRFDHAFTNMSVLTSRAHQFRFSLKDDDGYGVILNDYLKTTPVHGPKGTTVSLLPLGAASGIETTGLFYPLQREDLSFGKRDGQSNQLAEEHGSITIDSGALLVYVLYANADAAG